MNNLFNMETAQLRDIACHQIDPDLDQPRKSFDPEALTELADSIRSVGILQPILVRENDQGRYTIVYGERRWRAAVLINLETIPCLVQTTDQEKLTRWIVQCSENAHRRDLTTLEYVDTIAEMRAAGIAPGAIAKAMGKRPDWVRGHELAGTPAYRPLFETGRLRSVDVLLVFRSLPDEARRELLDEGGLITSTRCVHKREKCRAIEISKGSRQTSLAAFSTFSPQTDAQPKQRPERAVDRFIVSLALPATWIDEAGGIDSIRSIVMAALSQIRSLGWKVAS